MAEPTWHASRFARPLNPSLATAIVGAGTGSSPWATGSNLPVDPGQSHLSGTRDGAMAPRETDGADRVASGRVRLEKQNGPGNPPGPSTPTSCPRSAQAGCHSLAA